MKNCVCEIYLLLLRNLLIFFLGHYDISEFLGHYSTGNVLLQVRRFLQREVYQAFLLYSLY